MSQRVDTLITRYTLDESDYKQGVDQVVNATQSLVGKFQLGLNVATGIGKAIAAAGGAILGVGGMAVKAATDWEVLNASLAVVTGSFERAKEVADFADQLALPSAFFNTSQLAETAKLLETMQLNTERYLPLVSTMASLFGQSTESLNSFASALGRIKAGNFGEGFERMREFGIAAKDLAEFGVTFKGGQFQLIDGESTAQAADRALAAVEGVIKKRFGNMDAIMGETMSARFATLGETMAKGLRVAGEAINERLKKPFGEFVQGFSNFVNGPDMKNLAAKFASLIDFNAIKNGAMQMFASILAGFAQLPQVFENMKGLLVSIWNAGKEALKIYISYQAAAFSLQIMQAMQAAFLLMKGMTIQSQLQAAAMAVVTALKTREFQLILAAAAVGVATYAGLSALDGGKGNLDMGKVLGFDEEGFKADRDRIYNDLTRTPEGPPANPAEELRKAAENALKAKQEQSQIAESVMASEMSRQTGYLESIARNTDPARNSVLGGGSLAAKGVTPTELSAIGGRDELSDLARAMGRYMDKRAAQMAADMVQFNNPLIGGRAG